MCRSQTTRGFTYMNEDSIDVDLRCSICAEPFIEPVVIEPCKHIFCRAGIETALSDKPSCPLCRRQPITRSQLNPADQTLFNALGDILVKCDTCEETNLRRSQFHEHITNICPKVIASCSAADLQCPWTGMRSTLKEHVTSCYFELMRPILNQVVTMTEQMKHMRNDNQELRLQVIALEHLCENLQREIAVTSVLPLRSAKINISPRWSENGITVAGGTGNGSEMNQLNNPQGLYLCEDNQQKLYIADFQNHRIVEWILGNTCGKTVAGGNGPGNRNDQLQYPTDVIVDKQRNCLIICDRENRRVVRWSLDENTMNGETIIDSIDCNCLTMDDNRNLYITDINRNEVRRWRIDDIDEGVVVVGGNGRGDGLNQLDYPTFVFVDSDHSIYVSDYKNHRVMKWLQNATEGIVVAGGHGIGESFRHAYFPGGIAIDKWGSIYVTDSELNRVVRWQKGAIEGKLVIGGNGIGEASNQISRPSGLLLDKHGNLFVSEYDNGRVQRFDIITNHR